MSTKLKGLSAQLVNFLRGKDWFHKGTLTAEMEWRHNKGRKIGSRYLPETVGRALRLLEEKGIIAVKQAGLSVQYKHLPEGSDYAKRYIPFSCRSKGAEHILFRPK